MADEHPTRELGEPSPLRLRQTDQAPPDATSVADAGFASAMRRSVEFADLADGRARIEALISQETIRARLFGRERNPVRVGRFDVLKRVGAGGMGVVFEGYDADLDRKVAIKLVNGLGPAGPRKERARLLREAQAMARLSHPNVVQVYEVGPHEDQLFLAMEYVDGLTLGAWLDQRRRSVRAVLDMFVQAGRGLAAAHEANIVHRDFKPSNVLIDQHGRARVVDFGLARPTTPPTEEKRPPDWSTPQQSSRRNDSSIRRTEPLTRTGSVTGTPAYMAPEQHAGGVIDARADQFSFCVALFEALHSVSPFEGDTALARALNVAKGEITAVHRWRWIPRRVRRAVLRGLSVDPDNRFPSMHELVDVLEPRLHRRHVVVGATMAAAVIATVGLATHEAPCASIDHELADVWNDETQMAARNAFAATQLSYADAAWTTTAAAIDQYASEWLRARGHSCEATLVHRTQSERALDRTTSCLDRRKNTLRVQIQAFASADQHLVERASQVVASLPAIATCTNPTFMARELDLPDDPQTVTQLRAQLDSVAVLEASGDYHSALTRTRPLVEQARATAYEPLLGEALYRQATVEQQLGLDVATVSLEDALDAAEGSGHDELAADVWIARVDAAARLGEQPRRSQEWSRRAHAAVRRLRHDPRRTAALYEADAAALQRLAQPDAAIASLRRALELYASDPASTSALVRTQRELAHALLAAEQLDAAEQYVTEAIANQRNLSGPQHPDVGRLFALRGLIRLERGDHDPGRRDFADAREILQAAGIDRELADLLRRLAHLDLMQGRLEAAEGNAVESLRLYERIHHAAHLDVARALEVQARVALYQGRPNDARHLLERGLLIQAQGELSVRVNASTLYYLGRAWLGESNLAEANAAFERAAEMAGREAGTSTYVHALILKGQGEAHLAAGRFDDARRVLEQAQGQLAAYPGHDEIVAAELDWSLARVVATTDPPRAVALAQRARTTFTTLGAAWKPSRKDITQWLNKMDASTPPPNGKQKP